MEDYKVKSDKDIEKEFSDMEITYLKITPGEGIYKDCGLTKNDFGSIDMEMTFPGGSESTDSCGIEWFHYLVKGKTMIIDPSTNGWYPEETLKEIKDAIIKEVKAKTRLEPVFDHHRYVNMSLKILNIK